MEAEVSTPPTTRGTQEFPNRPPAETELEKYYRNSERYALMGLGRGVDITQHTPWLQKTSFQVRDVSTENLVETDDGGFLQAFSEEVRSRVILRGEVRASIKVPDVPLHVGLHSECTRSTLSSKHVVGTRVKNRTISFRADFGDVFVEDGQGQTSSLTTRRVDKEKKQVQSFEQRLCTWLDQGNPSEAPIMTNIKKFVEHFGITHYVSAIELGALEYKVVTEKEYGKRVTGGAAMSLNVPVKGGAQAEAKVAKTTQWFRHTSEMRQIGRITGKGNEMRVILSDEAVIGCQLSPITSLVKDPQLKEILRNEVAAYSQKKTRDKGPFWITCGDERVMYLTVKVDPTTGHLHLAVTTKKGEAEEFNVKVVDDSPSHHQFEFSITSMLMNCRRPVPEGCDTPRDKLLAWEYYLETAVNPLTGRGSEPPRMRINTNSERTRLLLKKRIDPRISTDTRQWRKGREACYISCVHRFRNGYLCVKERNISGGVQGGGGQGGYEVCIEPSIDSRCDEHKVFMLFKLQPNFGTSQNANPTCDH